MSKYGKATCPYCGLKKPLTKAGRIRRHLVTGGPNGPAPGKIIICGGSGRPA